MPRRPRLCPTACPIGLKSPIVKPKLAGIIIRVYPRTTSPANSAEGKSTKQAIRSPQRQLTRRLCTCSSRANPGPGQPTHQLLDIGAAEGGLQSRRASQLAERRTASSRPRDATSVASPRTTGSDLGRVALTDRRFPLPRCGSGGATIGASASLPRFDQSDTASAPGSGPTRATGSATPRHIAQMYEGPNPRDD